MKYWGRITLLYLLLVAIFGMLLRYAFINPGGFVFQFIKHTHSHVAFLGWVFNAVFVLVIHAYYKGKVVSSIKWQFYLFQLSVVGMMLSFPFQGYAPLSIAFSTLHVLISIWFYFSTITNIKGRDQSIKWIKLGAFFMVISNIGPLSLAPILVSDLKDTFVYHLSLQHYLHFQYNGWFIVATIGLLINYFKINLRHDKLIFWLLGWSVIPLFFITIEIIESNPIYRLIGGVAALAQLIGVCMLINESLSAFKSQNLSLKVLLTVSFTALIIKSIFQLAVAFPSISAAYISSHNPIIGFLHLIFLGVITNMLLALFIKAGFIKQHWMTLLAVFLFNGGVILMELLLYAQPFYVPAQYFHWLFYTTIPILMGVILFNFKVSSKSIAT